MTLSPQHAGTITKLRNSMALVIWLVLFGRWMGLGATYTLFRSHLSCSFFPFSLASSPPPPPFLSLINPVFIAYSFERAYWCAQSTEFSCFWKLTYNHQDGKCELTELKLEWFWPAFDKHTNLRYNPVTYTAFTLLSWLKYITTPQGKQQLTPHGICQRVARQHNTCVPVSQAVFRAPPRYQSPFSSKVLFLYTTTQTQRWLL